MAQRTDPISVRFSIYFVLVFPPEARMKNESPVVVVMAGEDPLRRLVADAVLSITPSPLLVVPVHPVNKTLDVDPELYPSAGKVLNRLK